MEDSRAQYHIVKGFSVPNGKDGVKFVKRGESPQSPISPLSEAIKRMPRLPAVRIHKRSASCSYVLAGSPKESSSSMGIPIPGSRGSCASSCSAFDPSYIDVGSKIVLHRRLEDRAAEAYKHQEEDTENEDEELKDAPALSMEEDEELFMLEIPKPADTLPLQGRLRIKIGNPAR